MIRFSTSLSFGSGPSIRNIDGNEVAYARAPTGINKILGIGMSSLISCSRMPAVPTETGNQA